MDAVGQYIKGSRLAAVVTNEYFYRKSLILWGSVGLQRKLSMTPPRNRFRDIKVLKCDVTMRVFYM